MNSFATAIGLWLSIGLLHASEQLKSAPPASVSNPIKEESLATVTLTPQAEQRLGISTAEVVSKKVRRTRVFGGELLVALGRNSPTNGSSIYSILPGLTAPEIIRVAEMQVDADGQIAAAKVQLQAAETALKRAEGLLADKAGSVRTVDEARALAETARANLQTAQARRALLGAPIFDAVKQDVLWVRVPVYVGDAAQINQTEPGRIGELGGKTNTANRTAKPVQVPLSAASNTATIDLFYEVENKDGKLRPGQKVAMQLPLQGEREALVVPAATLIYDIHGDSWVYENIAPHAFTRRRVEVAYQENSHAVLARGLRVGAKVVVDGAAEIFGTEFGFGK